MVSILRLYESKAQVKTRHMTTARDDKDDDGHSNKHQQQQQFNLTDYSELVLRNATITGLWWLCLRPPSCHRLLSIFYFLLINYHTQSAVTCEFPDRGSPRKETRPSNQKNRWKRQTRYRIPSSKPFYVTQVCLHGDIHPKTEIQWTL